MSDVEVTVAELTCLATEAQEQEQLKKALNLVNKAIQLKEGKVGLWKLASEVLLGLRRSQDALNALLRAISLDPENVSLRLAMGDLLRSLENNSQAIRVYLAASRLSPFDPEVSERLMAIGGGRQGYQKQRLPHESFLPFTQAYINQEIPPCTTCGMLLTEVNLDNDVIELYCKCNFESED